MDLTYKRIGDPESFRKFQDQLRSCNLPADDLDFNRDLVVGYYEGDELIGTGALEIHGNYALLRSLSVRLGTRGRSIGSSITEYLLNQAASQNIKAVYLLTETAHEFFQRKGFRDVPRDEAPEEVKTSAEFSHLCPASAAVMMLPLNV